MEKFVLGTETHVEEAQILFLSIVGQGEDDKGEESTVELLTSYFWYPLDVTTTWWCTS